MSRVERWVPLVAAGFLVAFGVLEPLTSPDLRPAAVWAGTAVAVAGALLAAARPLAGTALLMLAFLAQSLLGQVGPSGGVLLAMFAACGWAAFTVAPARSWITPVVGQVGAVASSAIGALLAIPGASLADNIFFSSFFWLAWVVGLAARQQRRRADQLGRLAAALDAERETRERAVLAEERARIAREVHDAVAHSVSVMVLQLGVVRSTARLDEGVDGVLAGLERLGRETVVEMRGLVGILRDTEVPAAPEPSLDRLDELLADVRAAGLPVELTVRGEPSHLPRILDVSAYRVLQEALTNVLRHAGPSPTRVLLEHARDAVVVEVVDDGPVGDPPAPVGGDGHGLVGMRERVAVFGGSLEAGPRDTGYAVRARFPVRTAVSV
ncbi:sensor histidine kinase [Actinomycetospora flava]|uniref:histidine kinase n=1 Tax=Actinomycetospora flava TaxID=3129232 RepID=A0ABU8M0F6_9PSEU